jgi:hypothetical protein
VLNSESFTKDRNALLKDSGTIVCSSVTNDSYDYHPLLPRLGMPASMSEENQQLWVQYIPTVPLVSGDNEYAYEVVEED